MCQKSNQNLSKWQLCDRNYQLRCLRAMTYPDMTWHDMTCYVIFMKMVVFYEKIYFFTWLLERITDKLSCCYIEWCPGMVSHDMTWHDVAWQEMVMFSILSPLLSLLPPSTKSGSKIAAKRTENLTLKILLIVFDLLTLRQIHLCKSKPFLIT